MKYEAIKNTLFIRNRQKLGQLMAPNSLAIIHAADQFPRNGDQNFPYRQHSDLFYLTGIEQEGTVLLLAPHHPIPAAREVLFILDADPTHEGRFGKRLKKAEAQQISGISNIQWISGFDAWLHRSILEAQRIYLNIYEYPKFSTEIASRDHRFAATLRERYPAHEYDRLAPLLIQLRMLKEPAEIDLIKRAIDITAQAFHRVLTFAKPGLKEYEIEAEIIHEFLRSGANGAAYIPIIASGANACVLHYISNDDTCKAGDLLLMDIGAEYGNYAADLSRTIPVSGRFSPRQKILYDAVHRVMTQMRAHFIPGNTIEKINKTARLMMAEELVSLGILDENLLTDEVQAGKEALKYMVHGITHHIGLDVHDLVDPEAPLTSGMVMTCEPGLYLPDEGIGIRIENDILVQDPPLDLMAHIASKSDEIEAIMASCMKK